MVYERVSSLMPKPITKWVEKQINYAGINVGVRRFVGFLLVFAIGLGIAFAVNFQVFLNIPALPVFFITFAAVIGLTFFWLNSIAAGEGKFVESILPDALQLIASNIKTGLTTERALLVSARPEFGPLSEELLVTSKRIVSGERIDRALMLIATRIRSKILERTMWLLTQSIKSGGQISELLIKLSDDLREENALRDEISANVSMYVMLIFFSAALGAPMLFGVSSYIVGVLAEQGGADMGPQVDTSMVASSKLVGGFIEDSGKSVTEEFVVFFVEISLLVTCLFSGLTIGAINTGKEINGVKYIPPLLIVSFAVFFISRAMMDQLFGSLVSFV